MHRLGHILLHGWDIHGNRLDAQDHLAACSVSREWQRGHYNRAKQLQERAHDGKDVIHHEKPRKKRDMHNRGQETSVKGRQA